jgi:hypothetical protein
MKNLNKNCPSVSVSSSIQQQQQQQLPARKSARLQGLDPEVTDNVKDDDKKTSSRTNSIDEIRKARVDECRLVRERLIRMIRLNSVDKTGDNAENANANAFIIAEAGKQNPTATYEHCLMRVRTMSHKQLQNRIRTIERAKGKHCVVKMVRFVCRNECSNARYCCFFEKNLTRFDASSSLFVAFYWSSF